MIAYGIYKRVGYDILFNKKRSDERFMFGYYYCAR